MNTDNEIVIGKHTLETLTTGMYRDQFSIYREYIQNSTDSIDLAEKLKLLNIGDGIIKVVVDKENAQISIHDNGTGISAENVKNTLLNIGNSDKDFANNRGFRGIGRLGGLGYADSLEFVTSFKGESKKSIVKWDCEKLKILLQPDKNRNKDLIAVINEIVDINVEDEDVNSHFFEVKLIGVESLELLDVNLVRSYLSKVAPVPFNHQKFHFAHKIKEEFSKIYHPIKEYKIYLNDNDIYKQYKETFNTGHQERSKKHDRIKDIKFFKQEESSILIYYGWFAETSFYGRVNDEFMAGIRIRKGNILIGDSNTFSQFFPVEKEITNSWFIGEVYIFGKDLIPTGRRDDFEKNSSFLKMEKSLALFADRLNKEYRRNYSNYYSTTKKFDYAKKLINEIESEIDSNGISSETKRDQLTKKKEEAENKLNEAEKEITNISNKFDKNDERSLTIDTCIKQFKDLYNNIISIENIITNADYSTKNDLPTSFSKEERIIYQKIIEVLDQNLDQETAKFLRAKIIEKLTQSKKRK